MNHTVYTVNRKVNRPISFRGLQGQYAAALGIGLLGLFLGFVILHVCGVPAPLCLGIVGLTGTIFVRQLYRQNQKYGQYGRMKRRAARRYPTAIHNRTRIIFFTGQ